MAATSEDIKRYEDLIWQLSKKTLYRMPLCRDYLRSFLKYGSDPMFSSLFAELRREDKEIENELVYLRSVSESYIDFEPEEINKNLAQFYIYLYEAAPFVIIDKVPIRKEDLANLEMINFALKLLIKRNNGIWESQMLIISNKSAENVHFDVEEALLSRNIK